MKALLPLLAAALATLAFSVAGGSPFGRAAQPSPAELGLASGSAADLGMPVAPHASPASRRAWCAEPSRLRLRRFEDRSARLECGRRLLLAVSVPG